MYDEFVVVNDQTMISAFYKVVFTLSFNRQHYEIDNCPEDNREDY